MKLNFKKLHPAAITPVYATDGSGCIDLAVHGQDWNTEGSAISEKLIRSGAQVKLDTGIAVEVPEGHVMLIFSRSGMGFNDEVRLSNCVGVIDSDYRGSIQVALKSDQGKMTIIRQGDRVCQALVIPVPRLELVEVAELSTTVRGTNGKGSTGSGALPSAPPSPTHQPAAETVAKGPNTNLSQGPSTEELLGLSKPGQKKS